MQSLEGGHTAIIVLAVIGYIAITSWLTVKLRSRNSSEFMSGGRATPAVVIGVLLMSEMIGAKSTIGVAQAAFDQGIAAAWAVASATLGFLLYGKFMAGRLHSSGEVTISGALAQTYGRATEKVVSLIMIYALLLVNVGNYVSGAAAVSTIGHIGLETAAFLIAIVSTFYYALGGMKSVAYISLLHTSLKYIGVFILMGTALYLSHGIGPVMASLPDYYFTVAGHVGWSDIIAFCIGNIGMIFSTQFIMQAIASTKDANAARRASYIAGWLCLPLSVALGIIGVVAKYLWPNMKSLYALPVFMEHMNLPLELIVSISLIASVFLGVCTVALAIASLVVRDFYVPYCKPTAEREMVVTRWLSILIGFLPLILVFFAPGLLKLSFFTRALRMSISLIAMIGFYLPFLKSSRGAVWGLIASCALTTVWYVMGDPFGINNMYVALVTPLLVMALGRLFGWVGAEQRQVTAQTASVPESGAPVRTS